MQEIMVSNIFFSFLLASLVYLLLLHGAKCETYTVGDEDHWSTGVNYLTWSGKYNFVVADILVFVYPKGAHDVNEVTEATFRSCNASNGVLSKYNSGNDQIKLTDAKKYWFICDIPGHCLGGMRFAINVTEASAAANTNNTTGSNPTTTPNKSCASERGRTMIYLLLLCGLLLKILG
ncbi:hypothetical protein ACH5RR_002465 [Cinchona calisaya]|uniref:Phytocyanin domain-containing protein n=1 Tax=Cinchona calisaya TaxID=153742 RepID=A0ABD3B6E3_9GENT